MPDRRKRPPGTEPLPEGHAGAQFAAARWAAYTAALGAEMLALVAVRMREDMAFRRRLMRCRSAGEMHRIQAAYLQAAIDRSAEETGRILALARRLLEAEAGSEGRPDPQQADGEEAGGP